MTKTIIAIDSEFQSLIPPLSDDEYERLEKSILAEGVRDPIITWNGTIIDGHNRYHICDEHGIEFRTTEREFASRDAAKLFIISNQLSRRNLPVAAIGLLKLEEKDIVARQAKERHAANGGDRKSKAYQESPPPNLGEPIFGSKADKHDGETLEILARDIGVGRESLRKLDVIKQKAEEGDPVAIEERAALNSGEKKSIHGAYVRVTGDKKPRSKEEATASDGRKICVMCGEPINEGEAQTSRPTVHKKCEQEYQRDWEREKRKSETTEDGRRICTVCGKPIDDGDFYKQHPTTHKKCHTFRSDYADSSLLSNVPTYTVESLLMELQASADNLKEAWEESISINEGMGVHLTYIQRKRLNRAVTNMFKQIESIRKEANNG